MHARQRNGGNGYRSGSIGMGMSGSRISPERPMRGHGFYGLEHQHRGFSRGYGRGRGRSKSYQNQLAPPLPPPPVQHRSGGGVFIEAGRLAAEYLVSQGVLSQTVLSSKWQNGNFRKQTGEFQSSRSGEVARVDVTDKRRYIDSYGSAGSRNSLKRRRSHDSHRYDSDFGRSGSCSERSKAFGDESVLGHREEQPFAEDIGSSVQRSASMEFMRKHEGAGDSESMLDKYNLQDEAQSKTGSSSAVKETIHDCEISKVSESSSSLSGNGGENKNQTANEDASIQQHCAADIDLATLCKFEKVPTKTRSSLTSKGQNLKEDQTENRCETQDQSSGKADSIGDGNYNNQVEDLALFPYVESNSKKESELELPNLQRSHSENGEKRAGEGSDLVEGEKTVSHESLVNNSINTSKTGSGYTEEHQLFPASFKICDLNLGEISDGKRESGDFDISISSSTKSLEFSTPMRNGKEIEVIDLDDDSPEVVKSSIDLGRKQEASSFIGIDEVPDYSEGLMMVEFLDSFGNIPTINHGISTALQNSSVHLQDPEEALGNEEIANNTDDDSIFMSLGEIPLTFLQAWDHPPPRGYEKPF